MRRNTIMILFALVLGYLAGCFTMIGFFNHTRSKHTASLQFLVQKSNTIRPKIKNLARLANPSIQTNNFQSKANIIHSDLPRANKNQTVKSQASITTTSSSADTQKIKQQITTISQKITTTQNSPLQQKIDIQKEAVSNPFATLLMKPNYILPFYYTVNPAQTIYEGNTPDNQKIMKKEFKAQVSFQFPLWRHILHHNIDLMAAYSQLFYWQFYAKSQYFRETNYEPEVFLRHNFLKNWVLDTGIVHQSNGRGGSLERSWNRAYFNLQFSGNRWYVSLKPWILIFKSESSELHNKDIVHYLGHGRALFAYKYHKAVVSLMLRNLIASKFKRATEQFAVSYPIKGRIRAYFQIFHGYGQSLLEYKHRTTAAGIGITLNDWI